jgi:hypothetical protein
MNHMRDKYRGTGKYDTAREFMIRTARAGTVVDYRPLFSRILGFDDAESGEHIPHELGQLCGEISEDEYLAGCPLLSAVVINQDKDSPGEGFFDLARSLNLFRGRGESAGTEYWLQEFERVCDFWRQVPEEIEQ